jgi:ankyrin repeat protein
MFRFLLASSLFLAACGSHHSERILGPAEVKLAQGKDTSQTGLITSAIRAGELERLQELLEAAPVEIRLEKNRTPLLEAIAWDRRRMAEFLISKGADPRARDEEGKDAFALAGDNLNLTQVLDPALRATLEGEFFRAIQENNGPGVEEALETKFVDPNSMKDGETALTFAIRNRFSAAFRPLFRKRSNAHLLLDVNKTNAAGESPLRLAVANNLGSVEKYLRENGAKE